MNGIETTSTLDDFESALRMANSYNRLPTLLAYCWDMPPGAWLKRLGEEWQGCDNIGAYREELEESPFGDRLGTGPIFEMMTVTEQRAFKKLPEEFEIFRGCYVENKWGMSWSLDRTVAERFPILQRYHGEGQAILVRARIKKRDAVALKLERDEMEIIAPRLWPRGGPRHISTSYIR